MIEDPSPQVRRELAIALRGEKSPVAASLWTKLALAYDGKDRWYLEALGIGAEGQWDEFFAAWQKHLGEQWNQPRHHDIIWRARAPAACEYLGQMIREAKTVKEQERYFRALDFHDAAETQLALAAIVAK